jgi:hypothetical protein
MKVSGDFCDGEKRQYAEMIAEALNKAASNTLAQADAACGVSHGAMS